MRRFLLICACLTALIRAQAQLNVQLHYDYGHLTDNLSTRPSVTSTIEYFGTDRWGSTFFFNDMDYYHDGSAGAYWEISRNINLWKASPLALHLEYNGGANINQDYETGTRIQHAVLAGGQWSWHNTDFTRTFSMQLLYKYFFKGANGAKAFNSVQTTAVWGMEFFDRKLTFSGYADLWYSRPINNVVFLSEPQLWLNIYRFKGCEDIKLSVGGEVEVSNNFIYPKNGTNNRFYAIPTTAVKWTF